MDNNDSMREFTHILPQEPWGNSDLWGRYKSLLSSDLFKLKGSDPWLWFAALGFEYVLYG